jgi:hypothetical protein
MLAVKSTPSIAAWLAAPALLLGCANTAPTSPYTPVTGVQILSAEISAGHGCGLGPDQVFQYAVLVGCEADGGLAPTCPAADAGPAGSPFFASSVLDCFRDALFSNLPVDSAGNQSFFFQVYAFPSTGVDGGLTCPVDPTANCPGQDPLAVEGAAASATWATTCTATQVSGATIIAACGELLPLSPAGDADADAGTDAAGE